MSKNVTIRLETFDHDAEEEKRLARQRGSEFTITKVESVSKPPVVAATEGQFIETVAIIAVASLAAIAKRMVDHWLKDKQQGVLIDIRESPPLISRIAGMPSGSLVVIDRNGQATTHHGKYESGDDLLPILRAVLQAG